MPARALFIPSPATSLASSPARPSSPRQASRLLHQLLRERDAIAPLRTSLPTLCTLLDAEIQRCRAARSPSSARRRVKLLVPADKFPDYNFVGRLLGPRGTTLKTLQRDTGCRIMIRGKGSIRKDKEPDVRGKPGWEHVFNEPLHVVIEAPDTLPEPAASAALSRATDAVELLLVPVPEERDALKRHQLRALAIMNGTFRGARAYSVDTDVLPSLSSSALPPCENAPPLFRCNTSPLAPGAPLKSPPPPRAPPPAARALLSAPASTSLPDFSPLSAQLRVRGLDELALDGARERSASSSPMGEHADTAPRAEVKVGASTALSAGGFIGREFYNGAFSNGGVLGCTSSPRTAWDETACSPPSLSISASAATSSFEAVHY